MSNFDQKFKKEAEEYEKRISFCDNLEKTVKDKLEKGDVEYCSIKVENEELLQDVFDFMMVTPRLREILKYLDLSNVSLDNLSLPSKQLQDTNLDFDPQKIKSKTLYSTNLENVNMEGKDYYQVCITGANLKNTNSLIDLENIDGSIEGTDFTGCTCIIKRNSLREFSIDEDTKFDDTIFVDKDTYNEYTDSYQIIATPIAKQLIKRK